MEQSPSKDLAEDLQSFHISSPVPHRLSNSKQNSVGKNQLKQYLPNNEFPDSKFLSYLGDSESKSYIKRLGDWSMNYGTVQQRVKSPTKGGKEHAGESVSSVALREDPEPAQFKQYLQNNQTAAKSRQDLFRDPESELILTASLNDISGIPTNTFKRHDHHEKRRHLRNSDVNSVTTSEKSSESGQAEDEENLRREDDNEEEEEDDVDPALEARGVFDNILKVQKSNYDFHQENHDGQQLSKDKYETDATSSYLGETPSSLSPNFGIYPEKPAIDGIKLITPEEMGLVFDNINGVWYKPPVKNQDISSSRTIDNGDSTSSEAHHTSEVERFMTKSAINKVFKRQESSNWGVECIEEKDDIEDDTPLEAPQINPQFLLRRSKMRNPVKSMGNTTQNMIGNITTASQVETSFQQNKRELIAVLTDVIAPRKADWTKVVTIDLHGQHLNQVVGLNEILPSLVDCNLDDNNLRGLQGIPSGTIRLSCRNNRLSTSYFTLDGLPNLEYIDLSHNSIGYNLSILTNSTHLREVNLSHNNLKSLDGELGTSRILKLNLSNNNIRGVIDFAQLLKYSLPHYAGSGWASIEELNLCNNSITAIKNVRCLPNLRVLKLDGNPIAELTESNELTSHNLKTLTITNTQGALKRIGNASLPYNRLRVLRTDCFSQLPQWQSMPQSLEELCLTNGTTDTLPSYQILPHSLRKLSITKIKGLKYLPKRLPLILPTLQELDLSSNQLESFYKLIDAMPTLCLVKLSVKNNPLSTAKRESEREQLQRRLVEVIRLACPTIKQLFV